MAQTKKKRRRKRRGTQGGRVATGRRTSRPRTREEAKAQARSRRSSSGAVRVDAPPTWRSATVRGLFAAGIFTLLLVLLFGHTFSRAVLLGLFMLAFYIPAGKFIDTMMWRRRERARLRARTGGS